MLNWKKGNHINDGIWWKSWYDNVEKSIQKYKKDINIESEYDSFIMNQ